MNKVRNTLNKKNFLILALLLCTAIARAQYNQVNDIPYREAAEGYAQERCKLDVYYPTSVQDVPVVVWFHGGGIEGGEKHIDPQLMNSGLVAPPIVIISGDRELELFGRYEEQAYFWRMLKLAGHKDVTIYEMQGYDHGSMPQPAYKILKDHIRRITAKTKE